MGAAGSVALDKDKYDEDGLKETLGSLFDESQFAELKDDDGFVSLAQLQEALPVPAVAAEEDPPAPAAENTVAAPFAQSTFACAFGADQPNATNDAAIGEECQSSRTVNGQSLLSIAALPSGPTRSSNFLIPGALLIGAAPSADSVLALRTAGGVDTVVSLVGEHEMKYVVELGGKVRKAQDPYLPGLLKGAALCSSSSHKGLTFIRVPLRDQGALETEGLVALVHDLRARIEGGSVVFVHCSGGHGRTGMVAIALVSALFGLGYSEAQSYVLTATKLTRKTDVKRYKGKMPETSAQRKSCCKAVEALLEESGGKAGQ